MHFLFWEKKDGIIERQKAAAWQLEAEQKEYIAVVQEKLEQKERMIEKQQIQIENLVQVLLQSRKKSLGSLLKRCARSMDRSVYLKIPRNWRKNC